jgi:hypothetical protein
MFFFKKSIPGTMLAKYRIEPVTAKELRWPFQMYFWSFVVAMVLFAGGAGLSIYKGIDHLISPVPVKSSYVNYVVIGLAIVFEGISWYIALKEFNKSKGAWGYIRAIHRGKDPSIFIVLMEIPPLSSVLSSHFWESLSAILPAVLLMMQRQPSSSG